MPYPAILYFDTRNKCTKKLIKHFQKKGYQYEVKSFESNETKLALKYHGHVNAPAPILQLGKMFFYQHRLIDPDTGKLTDLVKNCLAEHAIFNSGANNSTEWMLTGNVS